MRGPYRTGPYIYVCQECWGRPYLFFPDKEITEDGLTKIPRAEPESRKTAVEFARVGKTVKLFVNPNAALQGEIVQIELAALRLDSNNVRFRDRKRALEDEELEEIIWSEATTKNLMREILASKGLSEMPIVDSRLTVREGNRRIVCLRRLAKQARERSLAGVEPDDFDKLLVIVLQPDTDEKNIALYLARVHVGGKRQWMAVNKAAHVYELHTRDKMTFDAIWRFLSINPSTAERMINAYRDTLAFREKFPDEASWASKYSYFDEIYKRSELREWVKHQKNRDRLMEWIYLERIRTGADIRKLPLILKEKYALKIMTKTNVDKAYDYLARKDPSLADDFYRKINEVVKTIRRMEGKQLILASRDPNRQRLIRDLTESSKRLSANVEKISRPHRRKTKLKRNAGTRKIHVTRT
jgi:DNA-binding MarR family transcriptional regulator